MAERSLLHRPVLVLLAFVLVLSAAACGGSDDDSATTTTEGDPVAGGVLAFGIGEESSGWSPVGNLWNTSGYVVAQSFFDRLMAYDANGEVQPYLAQDLVSNDDFTEWTFTLRPDVTFHDDTPFDADALRIHFENMQGSAIWGAALDSVDTLEVVDPSTLVVRMSEPYSTFPHLLTAQPGFVAAPSQYESADGASNPVGTGPFEFDEWLIDQELTVRKNDSYWRSGFPLLDGIEFRVIPDSAARRTALESGDVDMMETQSAQDIADFEESADDGEFVVYTDSAGETTEQALILNGATTPFESPIAREAVAAATDREGISESIYAGEFEPANGPFKEESDWSQGVQFDAYDPARAEELVQQYEEEEDEPLSFTLQITPDPVELEIAQVLQQQWEAVGMEVEVGTVEGTTGVLNVTAGNYQMQITSLLWGSQNPDREYMVIHSKNSAPPPELATNVSRLENEDIDEALDAARTTGDRDEQIAEWARVQEGLAEENAYIWLVHNNIGEVATTRVRDVQEWTLPDGEPGWPQEQTVLSLYQLWLAP